MKFTTVFVTSAFHCVLCNSPLLSFVCVTEWSHGHISLHYKHKLTLLTLQPHPLSFYLSFFFPTSTAALLCKKKNPPLTSITFSPSSSSGRPVELVPSDLWWAAADVYGAGGGRVCAWHSGQHAVHGAHRTVHGCGQTAVHRPDSGQQALLFPR